LRASCTALAAARNALGASAKALAGPCKGLSGERTAVTASRRPFSPPRKAFGAPLKTFRGAANIMQNTPKACAGPPAHANKPAAPRPGYAGGMLVVSFYTADGNYAAYAEKLRASCERFGIEHQIEQLPSTKNWIRNIGLKPKFVYDKLMKNRRSVVWCDADCEIMEYPTLLDDERFDLMMYNWFAEPNPGARVHDPNQLGAAGGVFKVGYTGPGLQFLHKWIEAAKKFPQLRDDMLATHVHQEWKGPKLKAFWLPKSYNRMDSHWPDVAPVINHVYTDGVIFSDRPDLPARDRGLPVKDIDVTGPRRD